MVWVPLLACPAVHRQETLLDKPAVAPARFHRTVSQMCKGTACRAPAGLSPTRVFLNFNASYELAFKLMPQNTAAMGGAVGATHVSP